MVAGLDGDAAAHRSLLERLSRHLRAYYKGRLAGIERSATEAEDLCRRRCCSCPERPSGWARWIRGPFWQKGLRGPSLAPAEKRDELAPLHSITSSARFRADSLTY
jgi:hypothetical protein